jgi:hypothetical protein
VSQKVVIHRFVSSTVVIQAVVGCSRHNIIQIGFNKRDGSLLVSFPYGKHSQGLLSIGTIPAGRATAEVSLVERGKCASHKVKYTHHPDGRAHFSQDGKICTKIARQSVPLKSIEGHVFTVQAAGLHEFQPATRPKDLAEPTASRVNLPFELGSEFPQAIKIVGRLYDVTTLETRIVGGVSSIIGPTILAKDAFGQSSAFLVGNPHPALTNMILLVTCQIMPPQKLWSGVIFQGGFDPCGHFDDVSHSATFLALSYPVENFEDLESRLGSVDYEPSSPPVARTALNNEGFREGSAETKKLGAKVA